MLAAGRSKEKTHARASSVQSCLHILRGRQTVMDRLRRNMLMLALLLFGQGMGAAEAKTPKQCEADLVQRNKNCSSYPSQTTCYDQAEATYNRCICDWAGGTMNRDGQCCGTSGCPASSRSPDDPTTPKKPKGPQPVTTPPKSDPGTPTKPIVAQPVTPPKSNPTTPTKPKVSQPVTAPKSNSAPNGPVLR